MAMLWKLSEKIGTCSLQRVEFCIFQCINFRQSIDDERIDHAQLDLFDFDWWIFLALKREWKKNHSASLSVRVSIISPEITPKIYSDENSMNAKIVPNQLLEFTILSTFHAAISGACVWRVLGRVSRLIRLSFPLIALAELMHLRILIDF